MFSIIHLPSCTAVRDIAVEKEAKAYCRFLNFAFFSRDNIKEGNQRFVVLQKKEEVA